MTTVVDAPRAERHGLPVGWRWVKFGDVVRSVNENVTDPTAVGITRYVGLEHLDPNSLHIRRWGDVADGTTFTRMFSSGQVLFGKRRAYQRKAAVAEFDGICSGDILVFESSSNALLPELLPFIVQSDGFVEHALGTSAGSLSPRTRWRDLAEYEFTLPPRDEQRRIAEILLAAHESVRSWKIVGEKLTEAIDVLRDEVIYGSGRSPDWPTLTFGDVTTLITKGESPGWQGFKYGESGVRFITSENVHKDELCIEPAKYIPEEFHRKLARSEVKPQDVLVTLVGGSLGRACIVSEGLGPANVNQAVAVVRADDSHVLPEYLLSSLQSPTGFSRLLSARVETFKANISLGTIRDFAVPLPPVEFQQSFCSRVCALKDARRRAETAVNASMKLENALRNRLLEDGL